MSRFLPDYGIATVDATAHYVTYRQMHIALEAKLSFRGNSVTAYTGHAYQAWKPCEKCAGQNWYIVKSYRTIMYTECTSCGAYWFNREHYSRTTSKLQNIIRQVKGMK